MNLITKRIIASMSVVFLMSILVCANDMDDYLNLRPIQEWDFESEEDCYCWQAENSNIWNLGYDEESKSLTGLAVAEDNGIVTFQDERNYIKNFEDAKYIYVKMKTSGISTTAYFCFETFSEYENEGGKNSTTWNYKKNIRFNTRNTEEYEEYLIDISSHPYVSGDVRRLKFVMSSDECDFYIKKIAILSSKRKDDTTCSVNVEDNTGRSICNGTYNIGDEVVLTSIEVDENKFNGWKNKRQTQELQDFNNKNDEWMTYDANILRTENCFVVIPTKTSKVSRSGYAPYIEKTTNFHASNCSKIEIRLRLTCNDEEAKNAKNDIFKMYFCLKKGLLGETNTFSFSLDDYEPDEEGFFTIQISTADNKNWKGEIEQIRIHPTYYNKTMELDYIWFVGIEPREEYILTEKTFTFIVEKDTTIVADFKEAKTSKVVMNNEVIQEKTENIIAEDDAFIEENEIVEEIIKDEEKQETENEVFVNKENKKEVSVEINGEKIKFDQPPVIDNGRTLVPLRAIFESLGATVEWDNLTKTVTSTKDTVTISLQIGSNHMIVNGIEKDLDVPAQLINNRTLVPVRAISEAFGCQVEWNGKIKTVIITQ